MQAKNQVPNFLTHLRFHAKRAAIIAGATALVVVAIELAFPLF